MNRFITSDGLSIAYRDSGAGMPLLCLPALTRSASDFDDLVAAVGDRYRMIRLTPRGRGESDRDPDFRNYNTGREARDVVEFLDHLGLDRVIVIGTSRGGMVAMLLAKRARRRLAGVLLNDIGPELAPERLEIIMEWLGIEPGVGSFEAAAHMLEARLGSRFTGLTPERWLSLARRWYDDGPGGPALNYDPRLRDAVAADGGRPAGDMWPLFDALAGLPVAVVRGANSNRLTGEMVARKLERRPDLIVAEVPDRGHAPFLDEPQALAALAELVARVEA
jgi:pimeloyl-ACP methyl ester carboxylesterase